MRKWAVCVFALCVLLSACGDSSTSEGSEASSQETSQELPEGSPTFEPARVLIDTEDGSVIIDAEKAETPEQQAFGLMHRESLDPDAGMVFLYFEDRSSGFWMKNTLIPLSIAFFDEKGIIVKILDMEPCREEPCEIYDPGVTYRGALEVNQGTFEQLGVQVGDRITVTH